MQKEKEAAIMLAKRVHSAVRVLTNRTRDMDGDMPGNYLENIKNLENVLLKIAITLQKIRGRDLLHRIVFPKADASQLNELGSELDYAIQMFGFSADLEAMQALQAVRVLVSKDVCFLPSSQLDCPAIDPTALRVSNVLDDNDNYSVQVGTYQNQVVVVKQYYTGKEKIFARDLRERLDRL